MGRERPDQFHVHQPALIRGKPFQGCIEVPHLLALDEKRAAQDLVLDRLVADLIPERVLLEPPEERASIACRARAHFGRDQFAELDQRRMRALHVARGFAELADPPVVTDDLGEQLLPAVMRRHAQLDAVRQLTQELRELVEPRGEEVPHERPLVVEDDPEAQR